MKEILKETKEKKVKNNTYLRDKIIKGIEENIESVLLNGPRGDKRLSNNISFCFKNVEGESLLLNLDMIGIASSSGSACASGSVDPSHVLLAIGRDKNTARGSLRLSLGINNSEKEVNILIDKLPDIIERIRKMSPLGEN